MKLLFFNDYTLGVAVGDSVVDVSDAVADVPHMTPQQLMTGVITRWDELRDRLQAAADAGAGVPLDSVRVRPPLPAPANIDCMARNYMEDGSLSEKPPINAFHKTPSSIVGPGDTMILPDIAATIFEGQAELGVVIGRSGKDIPVEEAFYQMKSRDTFCPIGPFVVTADGVPEPQNLPVRLWNNGILMQSFNTLDMAYNIAESIAFVSSVHTIQAGDILATGTNHGGLHPFMDEDVVELEVGNLGRLRTLVRDDLKRTWKRETRLDRATAGLEGPTPQLTGKYASGQNVS